MRADGHNLHLSLLAEKKKALSAVNVSLKVFAFQIPQIDVMLNAKLS